MRFQNDRSPSPRIDAKQPFEGVPRRAWRGHPSATGQRSLERGNIRARVFIASSILRSCGTLMRASRIGPRHSCRGMKVAVFSGPSARGRRFSQCAVNQRAVYNPEPDDVPRLHLRAHRTRRGHCQ
jgi:hypothetical protein